MRTHREELDRDLSGKGEIVREEDASHSAASELPLDLITPTEIRKFGQDPICPQVHCQTVLSLANGSQTIAAFRPLARSSDVDSAGQLSTVRGRRRAIYALKSGREMSLAAEADRERHVHDRLHGVPKQCCGPFHPSPEQVLMYRPTRRPLERPREMPGAHFSLGSQGQDGKVLAQV